MKKTFTTFMMMAVLCLAWSCGEKPEPVPVKEPAPVMTGCVPENGAKDIAIQNVSVKISFDQNVKCTSDGQKLVTITPSAEISKIMAYDKDVTITLGTLEYETTYTVKFPAGCVSGYKDNPTEKEISVSFTTCDKKPVIPDPDPDKIPARGDNIAWKMAEKLALGFNLGNQMDAYVNDVADETCWGNAKATQQTFTKLKSYGFSTVRIPITWMGHIGDAPDYAIEKAWMDRVVELVGYAQNAGLICIINTHHDENNNEGPAHWLNIKAALSSADKNTEIKNEIAAVWGQIAERFKDYGDWLIFEPFNEIQDGGWGWSDAFKKNPQAQYDILNGWNQVFVDAVRKTGGNNSNRWLGIPGYAANPKFTMEGLVLPKDSATDRLMVGVHCYDPASFCGAGTDTKYDEWGHTGTAGKKPSEEERALRMTMASLYEYYVNRGIPCYFGEFGCVNKSSIRGSAFQKYYLEYFCKAARSFGLACIIWDNGVETADKGEAFGYINHGTGEYIANGSSVVPVMAKGQNDKTAAYTLESVYNNAPK